MIRATLLLLTALASIGMAYAWGVWVLVAAFAAVLTLVLFSSEKQPDTAAEADSDTGAPSSAGQRGLPAARHGSRPANL